MLVEPAPRGPASLHLHASTAAVPSLQCSPPFILILLDWAFCPSFHPLLYLRGMAPPVFHRTVSKTQSWFWSPWSPWFRWYMDPPPTLVSEAGPGLILLKTAAGRLNDHLEARGSWASCQASLLSVGILGHSGPPHPWKYTNALHVCLCRSPTSTCMTVSWCWPTPSTGSWRTGSGTVWQASTVSASPPSHGTEGGLCWTQSKRCVQGATSWPRQKTGPSSHPYSLPTLGSWAVSVITQPGPSQAFPLATLSVPASEGYALFVVVFQSLSPVWLFATLWAAAQ